MWVSLVSTSGRVVSTSASESAQFIVLETGCTTWSTRNNLEQVIVSQLLRPSKPFVVSGSINWHQLRQHIPSLSWGCDALGLRNVCSRMAQLYCQSAMSGNVKRAVVTELSFQESL